MNYKLAAHRSVRVLYDVVMLNVSMVLAVHLHNLSFLFRKFQGEFTFDFYINQVNVDLGLWFKYALPATLGSIVIFALFRFYNTFRFRRFRDRAVAITLGVMLSNVYLLLIMYFSLEQTYFPRGVTILFFVFTYLFNGFPRIVRPLITKLAAMLAGPESRNHYVRKVLVIGGGGYIGSVLSAYLLEKGYSVRVLDLLLFGEGSVKALEENKNFELVRGDFRNIADLAPALNGVDAVVHLGGLVGDPACAVNENLTVDVNYAATLVLMDLCKANGIKRFVFASTCSVYGLSDQLLNEKSSLNPVSLYAKTKIDSEAILLEASSSTFRPTILRLSTVFGLSPRPRFDLVVNTFVAQAVKNGSIEVMGGNQWRPFVHVFDVARAFEAVLAADLRLVGSQIFNVGDDRLNYTIAEIAECVHRHIPESRICSKGDVRDPRDYRVSFDRIRNTLGFECQFTLDEGILEVLEAVKSMPDLDVLRETYNNHQNAIRMVTSRDPAAQNRLYMADLLTEGYVKSSMPGRASTGPRS